MNPYLCKNPIIPYRARSIQDDSYITIIHSDMAALQHNAVHQHDFYELALIVRGSCELRTPTTRAPLIAGDLFLVRPDQPHLFRAEKNTYIIYCQFDRGLSPRRTDAMLAALFENNSAEGNAAAKRMRELRAFEQEFKTVVRTYDGADRPTADLSCLLHLSRGDAERIHLLFQNMLLEQSERKTDHDSMKQLFLDQLLITISRIAVQQEDSRVRQRSSWQRQFIDEAVAQIEGNLAQGVEFEQLAAQGGITLSHFRAVFKKHTGLSPVDYLNRARIMRALELLQTSDLAISEIAIQVGIYDSNYFTRLFKKVTGYPPRYFKSISH